MSSPILPLWAQSKMQEFVNELRHDKIIIHLFIISVRETFGKQYPLLLDF